MLRTIITSLVNTQGLSGLNDNRTENTISATIWVTIFFFFFLVLALLDVRNCPKLQSCATSSKINDATLRKWQKPYPAGALKIFFMSFTSTSRQAMSQAIILCNFKES